MIKNLLLTLGIILTSYMLVFSQASTGTLKGKIVDKATKEPIPFANVVIEMKGVQQGGTTSDFDGNYTIKPINPGNYDIRCSYVGYQSRLITGFRVGAGKVEFQNIELESTTTAISGIEVTSYKIPLFESDQTTNQTTVDSKQIEKMPNRSANAVAATIGGVFSADGERGSVRGERGEATAMYIDGVKVSGGSSSLPPSAIEQVAVIISGIPAQYGDATSGVINVTTKGPSNVYAGGVELQTSQFLDDFGYNRAGFNLQGPIIRKKINEAGDKRSVLGFFIAGDLVYQKDAAESPIGRYKVKDDVLAKLKESPLYVDGLNVIRTSASYLTKDDFEQINSSLNASDYTANFSGKLDLKISESTNFTLGGSFNYNTGKGFSYGNSMMNWENNGEYFNTTYRGFARFTQKFKSADDAFIKNAYYNIQADYSKSFSKTQNAEFKDNIFKIGYIGRFDTYTQRSYELGSDTIDGKVYNNVYIHNGYRDTLFTFKPASFNKDLSRYTEQYYEILNGEIQNANDVIAGGGLINGVGVGAIYGLWNAPGSQFNGYSETEFEQIGLSALASADVGNHELQFGIQYEQQKSGFFTYNPAALWQLMRGQTNFHILELDKNSPTLVMNDGVFQDTIYYNRKYDGASQRTFDINLRKKLGLPVDGTDFINIDSYDFDSKTINYYDKDGNLKTVGLGEDLFDISLFNADELLNDGISYVNYRGFNYKGEKNKGKVTLEDFLTKTDDEGNFLRELPAFEPIYMAGYIQDKFTFKDLIFNVGLRVDRFDANQLVLKDPFTLFNAYTAGEVRQMQNTEEPLPGNIGDDYIVYVDNVTKPTAITGFRNGSTWYNADGIEIADPSVLDAGAGVSPYLIDPTQKKVDSKSFKDYDPQVSVMPRISFSFPISEDANFYAHYDILTQRPSSSGTFDITDYYYFNTRTGVLDNPNLKPKQTIDYELGFRQKLSNSSAMSLSAYYKEVRNEIQIYRFNGAYPRDYVSYNNIDFGTVKGFTISYDLRETNNVTMRASYTLQFADGTGSSTTTAAALIAAGLPNLRTTNPLAWDRRHAVNLSIDYRFKDGKEYNGPRINRKNKGPIELLKNTGANFTITGGSGTPYTRASNITSGISGGTRLLKGSYFGSRLPWQFRVDARFDKDININWAKDGEKEKLSSLNFYLQVLNIFNFENVMGVYAATGNPDDDGYLNAAEWQREINEQLNPETFREMYRIAINNPGNYSSPRMIRLGVIFNF